MMKLEEFETSLKNRAERSRVQYTLNPAASAQEILDAEVRLGKLPEQVCLFYSRFNGLLISQPFLEILSLESLNKDQNGKVPFCTFGNEATLCFNTTGLNEADQWTIENYKSQYVVTLTMASFWSNKIFAWLDQRRHIWEEEKFA
jgi:hypothetical protein